MKSLSVFSKDVLRAVKNPKILIPIIAVICIPILYTGIYLTAFWDPYNHLERLPIAVVNEDKGADFEGESLTIGQDLMEELKEDPEFDWQFVNNEEAQEGIDNNKYYMKITIPEDFSSRATTLLDDKPSPAELIYEPNGSYNFVGAQIGNTAIKEISKQVSSAVTESYTETLLDKFSEASDGFGEAGDGAKDINEGAVKLDDGAVTLQDNLKKLSEGTLELQQGMDPLADGVKTLNDGAGQLHTGANELSTGLNQLVTAEGQLEEGSGKLQSGAVELKDGITSSRDGAAALSEGLASAEQGASALNEGLQGAKQGSAQLSSGLSAAEEASSQLAAGAETLAAGLQQLAESNTELAASPEVQKLLAASQSLAEGAGQLHAADQQLLSGAQALDQGNEKLAAGAQQLLSGHKELASGASALAAGQEQLLAGADTLAQGQGELNSNLALFGEKLSEAASGGETLSAGASELYTGTGTLLSSIGELTGGVTTLADGSAQLTDGAGELHNGLSEIKDGSSELSTQLKDAASDTSELQQTDEVISMFAEPVQTIEDETRSVANYGTGLTPYFMSIGLFVGALITTIIMNMRETSVPDAGPWSRFVSRFLAFGGMSVLQAVILATFMLYGLKLEVASIPLFYVFSIIVGFTSMMIVQALVTWLDLVGRYLVIVLLVFQLATSGGTFPLELLPEWMKPISSLLPMYHSVIGYKAVIMSGNFNLMWDKAATLGIYAGISLLLTLFYFLWSGRRRKQGSVTEDAQHTSGDVVTV